MTYSEYRDLTPIDNVENGDKYIEALNWAFQNKKIKNIALTGPYGAGKSSIIETFLAQDDKKKSETGFCLFTDSIRKSALKISMATFLKGYSVDDNESSKKIKVDADEVEKGILKQLFYKVDPSRIPRSRYRKLHQIKFVPPFIRVLIALLFITLLSAIFAVEKFDGFVQSVKDFLPLDNPSYFVTLISIAVLFFVVSGVIVYLYRILISKFRIKEIKLPTDTTVQRGGEESDSVFNKNLDEIMYFFESTGYRTVFFEDLDRLDDPKIFVHLRELNNLLNNDDSIKKKPIVFVYAVRDDIFSKEDRTKFFDFIIPIIPVINSTNSGEILLQRLQEAKENGIAHNISQKVVLDIAPFISDMRVLQNIYNEFVIYKDTLCTSQELSLSDEQMLAMIVFKNLYPSDFAEIQDEKGIVKKAFADKHDFISNKLQNMQITIDNSIQVITQAQKDVLQSMRELKYAMFGELIDGFGAVRGFCINQGYSISVSATEVMKEDYDMLQLSTTGYRAISYYDSDGYLVSRVFETEALEKYIKRWQVLKKLEDTGLTKMQEEIQELRTKQHSLSGMTIKRLVEIYPIDELLSPEVRSNKLLTYLLRRGYIDEKYASYINYFKGTSITKDDMNFILSVKNQEPFAFDYPLSKTSMVIQRLQEFEFEEKAIYNFALLEQLLSEGNSAKLDAFIGQLSDETETSWRFIDEFFSRTEYCNQLIFLLAEKWTSMWAYISADETITYDRQLEYLREIIKVSKIDTIAVQNEDGCMTSYFEQHDDILQRLVNCNNSKLVSIIQRLDVHFVSILIDGVTNEVLDGVFDGHFYELNDEMIQIIVLYKNSSVLNELAKRPYTAVIELGYASLMQYIHDNIETYVREIIFAHSSVCDRPGDVVDLIVRLNGYEELQLQLIHHEEFFLESIEDCAGEQAKADKQTWLPVWNALLQENIVIVNWENVVNYWKIYQFSEELRDYISCHVDELSKADTSTVGDLFIKNFITVGFDYEIEKKIIPIMRMETFDLDILTIEPATLHIMIDCRYFEFTANRYSTLASISPILGGAFIQRNQDEFMAEKDSIAMSDSLFENLICSERFQKQYKDELFTEYAVQYMTEKVALYMGALSLPITEEIFNAAWNCVNKEQLSKLLFEHCTILGADELEERFKELGGKYAELADRSKRHEVSLFLTPQNIKLAEHLEKIGYITSKDERTEKIYDAALEQEKTYRMLRLRIKQVK